MSLTLEDKEEILEFIELARQSGKSETSGLADTILQKMDSKIGEAVETYVNGKIKSLTQTVETHFTFVNKYIKDDTAWKDRNEPYLQALANISGTGKIVVWLAVGIGAVIGAWVAIKSL